MSHSARGEEVSGVVVGVTFPGEAGQTIGNTPDAYIEAYFQRTFSDFQRRHGISRSWWILVNTWRPRFNNKSWHDRCPLDHAYERNHGRKRTFFEILVDWD